MLEVVNKSGFIMTFLGDASKASLVVWIGRMFELADPVVLLGVFFVIIGHIWPITITLRFHGGKGVSSFLGGTIAFDPTIALVLIISFSLIYLFVRNFSKAGLISFLVIPIYCYFASYSYSSIIIIIMAVGLILFAHSKK